MKKIIFNSLVVAFCLTVLNACKKDDISIQKNDSTTWEIDKKIVDDDIRTRIGYDPRFDYVTPTASEVVAPMLNLEGFTLTDKNTRTLEVKLTKASDKDVTISLMYDASLFNKIAGTTTTTFEIQVTNQSSFNKKVILPFVVKASNNEFVKTLSGKDYFVVRIYPKNLTFDTANKKIIKEAVLKEGKAELTNKVVNVAITSSDAIGTPISLGLERDNSLLTSGTLAPQNIVGTISKVDFKDKTTGTISFTLQNIESITTKGTYVIPFKLMAYDASGVGHQVLNTPIIVTVEVNDFGIPDSNNLSQINSYSGALIGNGNYSFSSNYASGHLSKLKDGTTTTGNWWIDTELENNQAVTLWTTFDTPSVVRGIKITQKTEGKRIDGLMAYASNDSNLNSFKIQGMFAAEEPTGEVLYLKFEKPIKAKYLILTYIQNSEGQYIDIHEMEFF